VERGQQLHAGADLDVIADRHGGPVEHDRAVVDERPGADPTDVSSAPNRIIQAT